MIRFIVGGFAAKFLAMPAIGKLAMFLLFVAPLALAADAPVRDPFFDILGLIFLNAVVTGAPEPDMLKEMDFKEFMYLWFYRSAHGFLGSATAYFSHKSMWPHIAGDPPLENAAILKNPAAAK